MADDFLNTFKLKQVFTGRVHGDVYDYSNDGDLYSHQDFVSDDGQFLYQFHAGFDWVYPDGLTHSGVSKYRLSRHELIVPDGLTRAQGYERQLELISYDYMPLQASDVADDRYATEAVMNPATEEMWARVRTNNSGPGIPTLGPIYHTSPSHSEPIAVSPVLANNDLGFPMVWSHTANDAFMYMGEDTTAPAGSRGLYRLGFDGDNAYNPTLVVPMSDVLTNNNSVVCARDGAIWFTAVDIPTNISYLCRYDPVTGHVTSRSAPATGERGYDTVPMTIEPESGDGVLHYSRNPNDPEGSDVFRWRVWRYNSDTDEIYQWGYATNWRYESGVSEYPTEHYGRKGVAWPNSEYGNGYYGITRGVSGQAAEGVVWSDFGSGTDYSPGYSGYDFVFEYGVWLWEYQESECGLYFLIGDTYDGPGLAVSPHPYQPGVYRIDGGSGETDMVVDFTDLGLTSRDPVDQYVKSGIWGLVPIPDGNLWALSASGELFEFSASGILLRTVTSPGSEFHSGVWHQGAIYLGDRGNGGRLLRFDPESSAFTVLIDDMDALPVALRTADYIVAYGNRIYACVSPASPHPGTQNIWSCLLDGTDQRSEYSSSNAHLERIRVIGDYIYGPYYSNAVPTTDYVYRWLINADGTLGSRETVWTFTSTSDTPVQLATDGDALFATSQGGKIIRIDRLDDPGAQFTIHSNVDANGYFVDIEDLVEWCSCVPLATHQVTDTVTGYEPYGIVKRDTAEDYLIWSDETNEIYKRDGTLWSATNASEYYWDPIWDPATNSVLMGGGGQGEQKHIRAYAEGDDVGTVWATMPVVPGSPVDGWTANSLWRAPDNRVWAVSAYGSAIFVFNEDGSLHMVINNRSTETDIYPDALWNFHQDPDDPDVIWSHHNYAIWRANLNDLTMVDDVYAWLPFENVYQMTYDFRNIGGMVVHCGTVYWSEDRLGEHRIYGMSTDGGTPAVVYSQPTSGYREFWHLVVIDDTLYAASPWEDAAIHRFSLCNCSAVGCVGCWHVGMVGFAWT